MSVAERVVSGVRTTVKFVGIPGASTAGVVGVLDVLLPPPQPVIEKAAIVVTAKAQTIE